MIAIGNPMMCIVKTERTELHLITLADAPFFLELLNTPTWLRFVGDRGVRDVKDAEKFLADGLLQHYQDHGFGYYLVRSSNGTAIGTCGFLKKPYLEFADLGFAFLSSYQWLGYGTEVATALLDYAAQRLGLKTLDAVTSLDNAASIRLLEKLGFQYQRTMRLPDETESVRLYRLTTPNSDDVE